MKVVGGYYLERCVWPDVDVGFGSGGRAAMALALGGIKVDWHYYCPTSNQANAAIQLNSRNVSHHPVASDELISFRYFHPLSKPVYSPASLSAHATIEVSGENVLRFGFMEGDAKISGDKVVYDPQSPKMPIPFSSNGSSANELAVILNTFEVLALGHKASDEGAAVRQITDSDGAKVVVVKAGARGCRVYIDGKFMGAVPPYRSNSVYKVGTGDVFSAAFAFHWAVKKQSAIEAADAASRCTARYCSTRLPSVTLDTPTKSLIPVKINRPGMVYIAGPFFTLAELWLIEEAWVSLSELGVRVFSPYHDVGTGPPEEVVQPDLDALDECTAVFAILDGCDPGTLFEIGYAVKKGIPVVALSQNPKKNDQTMLLGSPQCEVKDDFATAIYHAAWESWK